MNVMTTKITKITESEIERFAVDLLEKEGYGYIYGSAVLIGLR
jgi:hypothetical protein